MRAMTGRRLTVVVGALTLLMAFAPAASAKIAIHRIVYNPPGKDTGKNAHLNREIIVLRNTGAKDRRIGNWRVRDTAGHRYTFPEGFKLRAGRYVRLHTGKGTKDSNDVYWNRGWYVWNNDGDRATLKNAKRDVIDRCKYAGGGAKVRC